MPPGTGRVGAGLAGWLGGAVTGAADLIFAGGCAGCGATGAGALCQRCRHELDRSRPAPARPSPAPAGLPACHALGGYAGVLRQALLGYKERGRYPLAGPLGDRLAAVVAAAVPDPGRPVLLVPVPDAPAAARERYGDHLRRLADRAAARLRADGRPVAVAPVLLARPRADSARLGAAARAATATSAFRARPRALGQLAAAVRAGALAVPVDDILTTGATLAATAQVLRAGGVPVRHAAVLAATRRRSVR